MDYCAGGDLFSRIHSGTLTSNDEMNWYVPLFGGRFFFNRFRLMNAKQQLLQTTMRWCPIPPQHGCRSP
jgi:hypothetical protein